VAQKRAGREATVDPRTHRRGRIRVEVFTVCASHLLSVY
jgi:hypothetical protein